MRNYTCEICGKIGEIPNLGGTPKTCPGICRQTRSKALAHQKYLKVRNDPDLYEAHLESGRRWTAKKRLIGFCDICSSFGNLVRDHDHKCCAHIRDCCGRCLRGTLCNRCNMALGYVKDDAVLLLKLADYIVKTNSEVYV